MLLLWVIFGNVTMTFFLYGLKLSPGYAFLAVIASYFVAEGLIYAIKRLRIQNENT
jgi:hypothetical protein